MKNIEIYKNAFVESFEIALDDLSEDLDYNSISEWDSVGHMTLIANLEESFDIAMDTEDVIDFSSFKKGIEILKKYKIEF